MLGPEGKVVGWRDNKEVASLLIAEGLERPWAEPADAVSPRGHVVPGDHRAHSQRLVSEEGELAWEHSH